MLRTLHKIATQLENDGHFSLADQADDLISVIAAGPFNPHDPGRRWIDEQGEQEDEDGERADSAEPGQLWDAETLIDDSRDGEDAHPPEPSTEEEIEHDRLSEVGEDSVGFGGIFSQMLHEHADSLTRYVQTHDDVLAAIEGGLVANSEQFNDLVDSLVERIEGTFVELASHKPGEASPDAGFDAEATKLVFTALLNLIRN